MQLEISKKISGMVDDLQFELLEEVENGNLSALEVITFFRTLEKVYEGIKEQLMEFGIGEFNDLKEEKNLLLFGNFEIKVQETAVSYDYQNDHKWLDAKVRLKALQDAQKEEAKPLDDELKEREKYLKNLQPKIGEGLPQEVDEETGEIYTVLPAVKSSRTILFLSYKKPE